DARPKEQGGQRWFHLYPNEEIKHDDVLHWTKLNQNWNFMCAECHSTGVHKNYDAAADRFATTWAEISVACKPCHGQGSRHVAWARAKQSWWPFGKDADPRKGFIVLFDERRDVVWRIDSKTGNAQRNFTPALVRREVETCGLCHARRGEFSEDWVPGRRLSDTHVVSPLTRAILLTGRCSTRSTIMARSSRARCSRRASPAAIATSPTALNFARARRRRLPTMPR